MRSILDNTRKPDIVFHSNGNIDISVNIVSRLRIKIGDVIDILTDEDEEEYYLYIKLRSPLGRHEGTVRRSNANGNHSRASSLRLCREMLHVTGQKNVVRLTTGEVEHDDIYGEILPIITKKPIL